MAEPIIRIRGLILSAYCNHRLAFVFAGAERRRSKYGFARRAVLETVLLDRAAFNVVLEQDIARRVARHAGRGDNVILELLECGRVSVAMRPADDSVIDARKLLKEPVTERPKSDFAADGIDGPAIEGNRAWSGQSAKHLNCLRSGTCRRKHGHHRRKH
jgi:hypothetical protein